MRFVMLYLCVTGYKIAFCLKTSSRRLTRFHVPHLVFRQWQKTTDIDLKNIFWRPSRTIIINCKFGEIIRLSNDNEATLTFEHHLLTSCFEHYSCECTKTLDTWPYMELHYWISCYFVNMFWAFQYKILSIGPLDISSNSLGNLLPWKPC